MRRIATTAVIEAGAAPEVPKTGRTRLLLGLLIGLVVVALVVVIVLLLR
ncbi:hypothetical protein [Pseudonocardia sp. N23]|nr:hypothetical protein [Pseudonocardia sp. N23]GAY09913.1 hypothetical protein TOK_4269 [Pseudonocardia sp. N23]